MFAAFAERYQIWAAGAHPLVGAAARKGGAREGRWGKRRGEKKGERKGGRKLEVKAKCLKCNNTIFFPKSAEGWKGHQRERLV